MQLYNVKLIGINALNGERLVFTIILILILVLLRLVLHALARLLVRGEGGERIRFWSHQAINIFSTAIFLLGFASIWFRDPARLATAFGLISAGLAFALQKLVTAVAGYFVILRGKTFNVGDRIVMGGVRGDVIALDFIQTTILEMGQPPSVSPQADPAIWVRSRQFTGRIVTVSNGRIFDEPVYNYTRDFPFIYEEISVGIGYSDKYERAEEILLETARKHTEAIEALTPEALQHMGDVFNLRPQDVEPRVYYRMTDNWVELTVRFVTREHDVRALKDGMYRDILKRFSADGISIASGTYDIVGLPPIRIEGAPPKKP